MNLEAFCWHEDVSHIGSRPELLHPFLYKGYIYATTGRVLIRVPEGSFHGQYKPFPKLLGMAASIKSLEYRKAVRGYPFPSTLPEQTTKKCDECDGSGICFNCACLNCEGKGLVPIVEGVWVGGALLCLTYLRVIHENTTNPRLYPFDTYTPVKFTAVDCEGLIMPMRRDAGYTKVLDISWPEGSKDEQGQAQDPAQQAS